MELIRGLHNLRPRHRGCVATIGNFDGVHLGHQAVIGQLAEKAQALRDAGLSRVNISLDALREETFQQISRRPGLDRVLGGIDAAPEVDSDAEIFRLFEEAAVE